MNRSTVIIVFTVVGVGVVLGWLILSEHARGPGMDIDALTIIFTIVFTGVAVVIALARLIKGETARIDADRRASDARHDADMREFRTAMDTFRTEMLRFAERQSRVEGHLAAQPGSAAD